MKWVFFAFAAFLAACGTEQPLRDRSAQFSSIALFEVERFSGAWFEIAGFAASGDCPLRTYNYHRSTSGTFEVYRGCEDANQEQWAIGTAEFMGHGRFSQTFGSEREQELWVLWVDTDYRTVVIATRDGGAAWILNRSPKISEDRLNAAKQVLRFNGYDADRLIRFAAEVA